MTTESLVPAISLGLWERLLSHHAAKCQLHSIFRTAINFKLKGQLITVLAPNRRLVPFSVRIVPYAEFQKFHKDPNSVYISKTLIKNKYGIYPFSQVEIKDLQLKTNGSANKKSLEVLRSALKEELSFKQKKHGNYNFVNSLLKWAEANPGTKAEDNLFLSGVFQLPFQEMLQSKTQCRAFCLKLLGWGEGSTPAGDDFLVGCLAAINTTRAEERPRFKSLVSELSNLLNDAISTTLHSKEFLRYALKGEFSEEVLEFCSQIVDKGKIERQTLFSLLSSSSSGFDFLWGYIWIIEHL